MRDHVKKKEDDLLVVHKPPLPADKMGRESVAHEAEALPADVNRLVSRLLKIADAKERKRLVSTIQSRFGNAFAAQVIDAFDREQSGPPQTPVGDKPSGSERR